MQFGGDKPIFLQLAEQLEDGILSGAFPEEGQIPSITEYASTYKINPADRKSTRLNSSHT